MKWDYRVESDLKMEALKIIGLEGWELVSVSVDPWVDRHGFRQLQTYYYFKRPLK